MRNTSAYMCIMLKMRIRSKQSFESKTDSVAIETQQFDVESWIAVACVAWISKGEK